MIFVLCCMPVHSSFRMRALSCCSFRARFCRHNRCNRLPVRILPGADLHRTMASDSGIDSQSSPEADKSTMSRTHQYRKVMKPMLERKRRARINKCLDELKDLMVSALQTEGESITKLEKADVLELTVRHLRKLKAQGGLSLTNSGSERFRSGFRLCVGEITRFVTSGTSGIDLTLSARLLQHMSICLQSMEASTMQPVPSQNFNHATSHQQDLISPLRTLSEFISAGRVENIRYSTSYSGFQEPMDTMNSPSPRPSSAPATVVKTEISDEKTWRPW